PGQLLFDPDFELRREPIRLVERRRGDVDDTGARRAAIGERRAAGRAERTLDAGRGFERGGRAGGEGEVFDAEYGPCHRRRAGRPAARFAVTKRQRSRLAGSAVADRAAQAAAFVADWVAHERSSEFAQDLRLNTVCDGPFGGPG